MSVPMNKWWAVEHCFSCCPICTLMKPLKWLKLSGKSELWVWSRLQQRLLFGLFWIKLDYEGVVTFPVCRHKRLQLILHWILCIAEHTVCLLPRRSTRALSQSDELQLKTSVMDSWSELNLKTSKVLQNSKSAWWLLSQCVCLIAHSK